jgi:hypothetical protein
MTERSEYDVAISFLAGDTPTASALCEQLENSGLKVFFFPRNQEELAGTDGLRWSSFPSQGRWVALSAGNKREAPIELFGRGFLGKILGGNFPSWFEDEPKDADQYNARGQAPFDRLARRATCYSFQLDGGKITHKLSPVTRCIADTEA